MLKMFVVLLSRIILSVCFHSLQSYVLQNATLKKKKRRICFRKTGRDIFENGENLECSFEGRREVCKATLIKKADNLN